MKRLLAAMFCLCLLAIPASVSADIAPPAQPPGANPEPGNVSTQVRMQAETVEINILDDTPVDSLGVARVTAEFIMRNLGGEKEIMAVRFPIGTDDGRGNKPEITDMTITVDGQSVAQRKISGEDPLQNSASAPWVEFDVVFPVQTDVKIRVEYTLQAAGEMPYIWFNYIFSTGAGWQGSIGRAELTVKFPYEVNLLNSIAGNENGSMQFTPGGIRSGNEIHWIFTNFEPNVHDNFVITMAAPSVWKKILQNQTQVKNNPEDGEAWGMLGKLYKSLLMSPHGGRGFRDYSLKEDAGAQELFRLSDGAYSKAVSLKPDDALWHAGYADLLGFYAYYAGSEGYDTIPASIQALREIDQALQLAPTNATVQDIAYTLEFYLPEGILREGGKYNFPWLTQTPLPTATVINPIPPTETMTILPTHILPTMTPIPVTTSESKPIDRLPICGSVILIPLALFTGIWKLFHNKFG